MHSPSVYSRTPMTMLVATAAALSLSFGAQAQTIGPGSSTPQANALGDPVLQRHRCDGVRLHPG